MESFFFKTSAGLVCDAYVVYLVELTESSFRVVAIGVGATTLEEQIKYSIKNIAKTKTNILLGVPI